MTNIKPSFFNDFKCIAEKCTDNCCIGWEIDIDPDSLEKYSSLDTPFGEKIRSKITVSEDASKCFKLCENDRCPFLNENNLCDIIINCGKDSICDICTEHPRFYNCYPTVTEIGLGLACEEACRLLIENEFNLRYQETREIKKLTPDEEQEMLLYNKISYLRSKIFEIMQTQCDYVSKIKDVISYLEDETEEMSFVKGDRELISDYRKSEPINHKWTTFIDDLCGCFAEITALEKQVVFSDEENEIYSKLFCYILYRHLSKAVYDGEIMCRICFAIESVRFIILSDLYTVLKCGKITEKDRINNIKRWSQQVEYSEENTEYLIFGE